MIPLVTRGYRPVFQRPDEALRQPNQSSRTACRKLVALRLQSPWYFLCVFLVFMGDGQKIPNKKKRFNTKYKVIHTHKIQQIVSIVTSFNRKISMTPIHSPREKSQSKLTTPQSPRGTWQLCANEPFFGDQNLAGGSGARILAKIPGNLLICSQKWRFQRRKNVKSKI